MMRVKVGIMTLTLVVGVFLSACGGKAPSPGPGQAQVASPTPPTEPVALPDKGFKAAITLVDPPAKLRAGQKETIRVKIRNDSPVMWWARGAQVNTRSDNKFYLATGNRWLKPDGGVVTNMDGRYGVGKDLAPGAETEVPLVITAPKEPGEYTLEVDLIQEQVAWFSDKGSPTAKAKITVVK